MRRLVIWILAGLVLLQLVAGAGLAWQYVGVRPLYGDTGDYLKASDTLRIRAVRGVLYPYLLAGARRAWGDPLLEGVPPGWRRPGARDVPALQLVQLLMYGASLAYFLSAVLGAPGPGPQPRLRFGLLLGLLWLDPVALHYAFAIMPDSLALSASLVFCAALVDLARGRGAPWMSGGLLVLAAGALGGLRIEKGPVALVAVLGAALAYALLARRGRAPASLARRSLLAAALVVAVVGLGQLAQRRLADPPEFSQLDALLTQRVVYPHLSEILVELPPAARSRIGVANAQRFDRSIRDARQVLKEVSDGDAELKHQLLVDAARVVVASRSLVLAADVAKDTLEHALPTASFYTRLGFLKILGEPAFQERFRGDGTQWVYDVMTLPFRRLAPLQLALAAALLVVACAAALAQARQHPPGPRLRSEAALRWLPVGCFVLANAAAFALSQDLVQIRYAPFAHVAFLAAVYQAALRWAWWV